MATGDITAISNELKENYPTGTFPDAVNREAKYRAKLKQADLVMDADGTTKFPLNLHSAFSVGIIGEGAFPTPYDPSRIKGTIAAEFFAATVQIGGKARILAKNSKGTFSTGGIIADRLENTLKDLACYMDIVYAGSNRGRLAVVESDGASATFVAAKPHGIEFLRESMAIDEFTALSGGASSAAIAGRQVDKLTRSTRTVTYSGADATTTATYHIFLYGTYDYTPYGLPDIVDNGDLCASPFGQARATYEKLKSPILANGGILRDLNEQLIMDAVDTPWRDTGKRITRVLANSGQARKWCEFTAQDRMYVGEKGDTAPSYTVGYGNLRIVVPNCDCVLEEHRNILPRSMFFLAWDTFGHLLGMDVDWITEGDGTLKLKPSSSGGYENNYVAYLGSYENQFCTMPAANSRVDDLVDPIWGD